jgi:DHA3 family macrolide efflux protein-like MFS transporter
VRLPVHPGRRGLSVRAPYRTLLAQRTFRWYFAGETISSLGNAMSEITVVLLALDLAGRDARPLSLALATGAYLLPGVVTGILAGPRLGTWSPRALLLADCAWRGGWLAGAAGLVMTDRLRLPAYIAILALASLTRPLGVAGGRTMIPQLVPEGGLFAANSLVNSMVQASTMLGPGSAGVLVALLGPGPVLGVDAASFLLFAAALGAVRPTGRTAAGDGVAGDAALAAVAPFRAGRRFRLRSAWLVQHRDVARLFGLTAVFYALYGPFVVALPLLVADRDPASTATILGGLWSAFGVGAIIGGLVGGGRPSLASPRVAGLIAAGWGVTTVAVALPAPLPVAAAAMFAGGVVYAPYLAIVSTVMQRQLPAGRLAEASAYFSSVTAVAVPAGTLLGGAAVVSAGPATVLGATGAALIGVGLIAARRAARPNPTGPISAGPISAGMADVPPPAVRLTPGQAFTPGAPVTSPAIEREEGR